MALLEAMASARPIVATAVGEMPAVLAGGQAGILVPSADSAAMAKGIGRLLADANEARRLGGAAADRAVAEYGYVRMLERYRDLYVDAMPRRVGQA